MANSVRRRRRLTPPVVLAAAMAATILTGSLLLRLPVAQSGQTVPWLDTLFTATSAVCVTGLAVVDTGTRYSFFGQVVILLLIQVGGLGIMTVSTVVLAALGQRPTSAVRELLRGLAGHRPTIRASDIVGTVFLVTIGVELAGALLLFVAFAPDHPWPRAAWLALFHSVSAFCNAGFGLWSDSLTRYAGNPLVNFTVMGLIVAGGLGFIVLVEIRYWAAALRRRTGPMERLSLHSKIVLSGTAIAIGTGMIFFLLLEQGNVLRGHPWGESLLISAFQSVTARTAGFNTVDTGALSNPTVLIIILLMFVGAGPGSMAGGIKLTSAATVLALVAQRLRGTREIRLFGRAIGEVTLQRAVVLAFLATLLIIAVICGIEIIQTGGAPPPGRRPEFLPVAFEVVSAFGTVGLSMGITSKLVWGSKLLIIGMMFVGRLGPLWLMDFFQHLGPTDPVRHASEDLMVG